MFKRISHKLNLLTYSWRAVGPGTMLRHSIRWAADAEARNFDSGFDDLYGTDTNAEVTPREAAIPTERRNDATMYLPTHDGDVDTILAALPWAEPRRRDSTFVDLGSGKGRVVFLAAMRRFREVVGVEISPMLHDVAENNLELMHATGELCSPVRLCCDDAASFEVPDGPVITYLYHPFRGEVAETVMERILDSVKQRPRPAAILYCHPTLQTPLDGDLFGRDDVFRCQVEGERQTRRFRIGWNIWTNDEWLD